MIKSSDLYYKHFLRAGDLSTKKSFRQSPSFHQHDIELAFVDIDLQLKQLADEHLEGKISKTRHVITVQEIRNRLWQLYNWSAHDFDVVGFAGHDDEHHSTEES